jgi:SAM-dependent methyltransferase
LVSTSTPRIADFNDPDLTAHALELGIPLEEWQRAHRKWWEWARVLASGLRADALRSDGRVLGIGSGHETPIDWIANHVRLMVATDLYGVTPFGASEADDQMMRDPGCFAPFEYDRTSLLVQRVDARALPFAAASFDFIFSCSSVEHFGRDSDVVTAMREAFRVLKPGGVYAVAVDCLIEAGPGRCRPRDKRKGLLGELLTPSEAMDLLVTRPGFELIDPIVVDLDQLVPPVRLDAPEPNSHFPHLRLALGDAVFTSLFLELRKPRSAVIPQVDPRPHLLGL